MMIIVLVLGVLVLIAASDIVKKNRKPQIDLGMNNGVFHEISSKPNCVSTQTSQSEKRVKPLAFKESLIASKNAIKAGFDAYGAIEIQKEDDQYIYAISTTGTMKFHDDIEIYFDVDKKEVHYRSASRAGYSDMGLNRKRFDAIADVYNKQ